MPRYFVRIIVVSILVAGLCFFLGSFCLLYFKLENWALVVTPLLISMLVVKMLGLHREDNFSAKILQAAAIVSGIPILLVLFLITGDQGHSGPISLGAAKPNNDFFAGLVAFIIGANMLGLVPAFLLNLLRSLFFLPKFKRARA